MGTQMRCRWPPRRDHCSIFGRNRSNPFAASWSWTRSSQWLRVHNACHAVDERTAPSWTAAVSRAGGIRSVGVTLFIGWASPPLVRGSLSGTNHTHLSSSCFAAGVRRADAPDRLFHRDALREVPGLVHVAAPEHRDVVRQELQRNRAEDRRQQLGRRRDVEHVIRPPRDVVVSVARDGDHDAAPSLHLFVPDDSAHTIWSPFALDLLSPYGRPEAPSSHGTPKSACGNPLMAGPGVLPRRTNGGRTTG